MPYITQQDMVNRYSEQSLIELTDRVTPYTGEIVTSILDEAIEDADALIDSFISVRYDLPLSETPRVLIGHAAAIAYYKLHRGRYPDEIRTAYEDAIKFLNMVSKGEILLDVAGSQPQSAPADARVEGPDRTFSRKNLEAL